MTLKHRFDTAIIGLTTHKSRSALTILGILIGITAIILIMSVGGGAEELIVSEINNIGAETIVIRPGKQPEGPTDLAGTLFADSLTNRDVEALMRKENVPGLVAVAPALVVPGSVSYKGETYRPQIWGWSTEFMSDTLGVFPKQGSIFYDTEIRTRASVAVIGSKVKEELFGESDAIGEKIKIRDRNFKVIGVFGSEGSTPFFNIDETVVIPYTTAQTYLLGIDYYHEILTRAESADIVDKVVRDIEATLRESHNITNPDKDDFYVETQQGLVEQLKTIIGILTMFLTVVVAISLVVGGIGVMNIMLVSVTERTREIGLRKALGATDNDILSQFLFESVILTVIGGVLGIAIGVVLNIATAVILSKVLELNWQFTFPIMGAILGFGVSALVGLIFGLYPARQAAKKSPIEALRYE